MSAPHEDCRAIAELATDLPAIASDADLALCADDLAEAREALQACTGYLTERARRRAA